MELVFDLSSETLLSYYSVLGELGWKEEVMFKGDFQFCRSAFKRKGGRKAVTWNRGRGAKGPEAQWYWTIFYGWKWCGRATERVQEYGKPRILRNQPKGEKEEREEETLKESENFTVFLKEAAAINSKFPTYTKPERQKGWLRKKHKLCFLTKSTKQVFEIQHEASFAQLL